MPVSSGRTETSPQKEDEYDDNYCLVFVQFLMNENLAGLKYAVTWNIRHSYPIIISMKTQSACLPQATIKIYFVKTDQPRVRPIHTPNKME